MHSGKGILIAVVLGPLCAAAVDLPARSVAAPAEPIANLGIQTFEHAKVAHAETARPGARAVRKQQKSNRLTASVVPVWDSPECATHPESLAMSSADAFVPLPWLDNPTSTGP
jgi:hypothetical protein